MPRRAISVAICPVEALVPGPRTTNNCACPHFLALAAIKPNPLTKAMDGWLAEHNAARATASLSTKSILTTSSVFLVIA